MKYIKYFSVLAIGCFIGVFISNMSVANKLVQAAYLSEQFPRLKNDVKFVTKLIDKNLNREAVKNLLQKHSDGSLIQDIEEYTHISDTRVSSAINGNGLWFYFDSSEKLIRIEHWLSRLGVIYESLG